MNNNLLLIDLLLYSETQVTTAGKLLELHASNLGYFQHLEKSIRPVVIQHAGFSKTFEDRGTRFEIIKGANKKWHLYLPLFFSIKKQKPGVVLVHSMDYAFQVIVLKLILGRKAKVIVQNHAEKPGTGMRKMLQKIACSFISGYMLASKAQGESWVDAGIISGDKIFEVMEGSTGFGIKARTEPAGNKTIFIWVGRLDKNKDPLTVLKAFKEYVKQNKNAELRMIYNANDLLSEIQNFIATHALFDSVKLLGELPHKALEQHYNNADYFILGSHYEGSGYALCEAMACGCVPVVTGIPSFSAMLNNGDCGYLFDPGNTTALQDILLKLNPAGQALLKEKVIKKFEDDLSFKAIGRRISDIVLKLSRR